MHILIFLHTWKVSSLMEIIIDNLFVGFVFGLCSSELVPMVVWSSRLSLPVSLVHHLDLQ